MCGIVGFITKHHLKDDLNLLKSMVFSIKHRGPDDQGYYINNVNETKVALGHARLSIIDLTAAGHQPMHLNHLSIVFNGEIYNYKVIKSILEKSGHTFQSNSDTEVILHSYLEWGKECVKYFIGMFSIAILDHKAQELVCFRDRAGVKPFYYYTHDGQFLFGSELKPFHLYPYFIKELNMDSVSQFFTSGYISAPNCIFSNTYQLLPGSILVCSLKDCTVKIFEYWNVLDWYKKPRLTLNMKEAEETLKDLLVSACNYRMVADVPVGIFLSGGYDSTLVAAILQSERNNRIKTFTIGFEEGNNEAPFAKAISELLGTDHIEYICKQQEAKEIIPLLPFYYDEPFSDSSAIPTILVSRIAKEHVTVALSADGGDEVFGGYESYLSLSRKLNSLSIIPDFLKPTIKSMTEIAAGILSDSNIIIKHKLIGVSKSINKDTKIQALSLFNQMSSLPDYYLNGIYRKKIINNSSGFLETNLDLYEDLDYALSSDYKKYLTNDILTKVDRATMSISLEGREPLLDHRLIEFAAQLPVDYKIDSKATKKIFKNIVHSYVPVEKMDRRKSGFTLPIYSWLRGDLSYLVDEYLNKNSLESSGIFDVPFVEKQVILFKLNKLHYVSLIWRLLMFQMWYTRWMK